MKRIYLLIFLCITVLQGFAQDTFVNGFSYKIIDTSKREVEIYRKDEGSSTTGECCNVNTPRKMKDTVRYNNILFKVVKIGNSSFDHSTNTSGLPSRVVLPQTIREVESYAFGDIPNLISVTFPDSVLTIGDRVFQFDNRLEEVSFGKSVKNIGHIFWFGSGAQYNLKKITCRSEEPPTVPSDGIGIETNKYLSINLFVPKGCKEKYKNHTLWGRFYNIIEMSDVIEEKNTHAETYCVDLGLPSGTLWAAGNLGATRETDFGDYFSWGEISCKSYYATDNYIYWNSDSKDFTDIGDDIKGTQYDAAFIKLGDNWCMPSNSQFEELINDSYCTKEWTTNYHNSGINGYLFTSLSNDSTLFFPAAGTYENYSIEGDNVYGSCWSSTKRSSSTAYKLYYNSDKASVTGYSVFSFGLPIRAVRNNPTSINDIQTEDSNISIHQSNGILHIIGARNDQSLSAYTVEGAQISHIIFCNGYASVDASAYRGEIIILKVDNKSRKILVQ